MEPIGATIIANPNHEFFQNTIDWYDTLKTYCKTLPEDFLAEYVFTATKDDGVPPGDYVFYVFHKNDKSHTPYSSFSIESECFKEMMAGDNRKFIVRQKETKKDSHFPHTCTLCKQPAYIGGLNNCECSNSNCSLFQ
jgi:hypothetical protein